MRPSLLALPPAVLALALVGCSREPLPTASNPAAPLDSEIASNRGGRVLAPARVRITTSDSLQTVVRRDRDPWLRHSTVTESSSFTLHITNTGKQPASNVRLLVAVPGDLPEYGWSLTLGNPGVLYAGMGDFPDMNSRAAGYPYHSWLYSPLGGARFRVIQGPAILPPDATWDVPSELFRGQTKNFRVHFDVAADPWWASPARGVTAIPPLQDPESGDQRSPHGGGTL